MLIKWQERTIENVNDTLKIITVPIEGKLIAGVAKRALTERIRADEMCEPKRFFKGDGFVRITVISAEAHDEAQYEKNREVPSGLIGDFCDIAGIRELGL